MTEKIECTYIGHTTTLIEKGQTKILTDPHFGKSTLIFPRRQPLPIDPGKLPAPSVILLSHTHYDHLHIASYKYVSCTVPIIVPEGSERAVGQFLPNPIIELSYFSEYELGDGTKITAVPLIHRSSRFSLFRYTKSNGYLIRWPDEPGAVFFCADSAYGPNFAEIGNVGPIYLALLPIGGYDPNFLFRRCHMSPAEAVRAFEDLKAEHMIPIHHGTFRLSLENIDAPKLWMEKIIAERPDLAEKIHLLKAGEKF